MGPDRPLITLTTDFDFSDGTIGAMIGVIKSLCPEAEVVVSAADIPRHDIPRGAWALLQAAPFFPARAIHVAVVDPGVGSRRRPVMAMTSHGTFIGPDNGLLSWAVRAAGPIRWIALENPAYRIAKVGVTFDGRDLFAPTAAYLARGVDPADIGPEIQDPSNLPRPEAAPGPESIEGEILVVDAFGNLITNIPAALAKTTLGSDALVAHIPGGPDAPLSRSYSDITGALGLVANGSGLLEVAAFQRSAAELSGLDRGAKVTVTAGGRQK